MDSEANKKSLNIDHPSDSQPTLDINSNDYPRLNLLAMPTSTKGLQISSHQTKFAKPKRKELSLDISIQKGFIKYFRQDVGHGIITRDGNSDDIFVHLKDIEGEYYPQLNDKVTFRVCPVSPKSEKLRAIHVRIVKFTPGERIKRES